jgi:hypothetical protein
LGVCQERFYHARIAMSIVFPSTPVTEFHAAFFYLSKSNDKNGENI